MTERNGFSKYCPLLKGIYDNLGSSSNASYYSKGYRAIVDSEVGLALLRVSTEKDCNPLSHHQSQQPPFLVSHDMFITTYSNGFPPSPDTVSTERY